MDYGKTRAWLEVDLDVLRSNYQKIKSRLAPETSFMTVVKADAYGLGAVKVAQTLERCGCPQFGTAYFQEAMELRENGVKAPILVLGPIPLEYVALAAKENIMVGISTPEMAAIYDAAAAQAGVTLSIQIASDVGMSRFGIWLEGRVNEAVSDALAIFSMPHLSVCGLYTHMTVMSHPYEREFDYHQLDLFRAFTDGVYAAGYHVPRHCACSAMTLLYPESHMDMIRVSALPFGLQNPLYQDFTTDEVIALKTKVVFLKDVPLGTTVGYGPHYTKRQTRLAVIPIGFGDGLHRTISDRAPVLIGGQRAKVFGKLCMDYTMVDVTGLPVRLGDEVTLFGEDHGQRISIFEYASLYGGTACEVACSLGKRINRVYLHE